MKLERTINYNFGWLVLVALVNVAFLLVFFGSREEEEEVVVDYKYYA